MKKYRLLLAVAVVISVMFSSCSHGISIEQAANGGKAKCGRNHLR